jgi:DNA helicase HerA-like ATPase
MIIDADKILIGIGDEETHLLLKYGNRHGLVTGATGTGKTVTLQGIAEGLSADGVPVFMADVKGDLAGVAFPGGGNPKIEDRAKQLKLAPLGYQGFPVIHFDIFGEKGHPIRATVSEMGPLLLSRMLNLNDTQEGVLNLVFKLADDQGLLLLDLKDLQSMLANVATHAKEIQTQYGNVNAASIGAIQRNLLVLEQQGGDKFFGEPALELSDIMRTDKDGQGFISILNAEKLMQSPALYATFLLWLLSELFEQLPEVGDLPKPKLVFFFDEAHLLFDDAPKVLLDKIEQVVRLIRSKGVGVFFVTQNPGDVPDVVLSQLSNRAQHALRAFTPKDQKAVQTAANTFRPNPKFKTAEVITTLGVGEALVSMLDQGGSPCIVQRAFIRPPLSRVGPETDAERQSIIAKSPVAGKYEQTVDRESAYETLKAKAEQSANVATQQPSVSAGYGGRRRTTYDDQNYHAPARHSDTVWEAAAKSVVRSASSQLGRQLIRGVLGSLLKR